MSLLDEMRQTLGNAATTAVEVGYNLGAQAQAQVNIKKLQHEQGKKLRELGARTYQWHQSGTLVAAGAVPHAVNALCHELDELASALDAQQRALEQAKLEAEQLRASKTPPAAVVPSQVAPSVTAADPAAAATVTAAALPPAMATMRLPQNDIGSLPGAPDVTQPTIPSPGPDLPSPSPSPPTMPGVPGPDLPPAGSPQGPAVPNVPGPSPDAPFPGSPPASPLPGQPSSPTM